MRRLRLRRTRFDPDRTEGELLDEDGERLCYTLEPGWSDTDFPKVDAGFYHSVRHGSRKYGQTWALEGVDVTHWQTPGIARSAVLLHRGNVDEETRGCILPGLKRGKLNGEPAVLRSKDAMDVLRTEIGDAEFYLTIVEGVE